MPYSALGQAVVGTVVIDILIARWEVTPVNTSDTVLPSSRQPMPLDAKIQAEYDRRRTRTADEIEADIAVRSERLAANIDHLLNRAKPGNIARSGVESVRSSLAGPDGTIRKEIIGAAVGALVGIGVLVWLSKRRR